MHLALDKLTAAIIESRCLDGLYQQLLSTLPRQHLERAGSKRPVD